MSCLSDASWSLISYMVSMHLSKNFLLQILQVQVNKEESFTSQRSLGFCKDQLAVSLGSWSLFSGSLFGSGCCLSVWVRGVTSGWQQFSCIVGLVPAKHDCKMGFVVVQILWSGFLVERYQVMYSTIGLGWLAFLVWWEWGLYWAVDLTVNLLPKQGGRIVPKPGDPSQAKLCTKLSGQTGRQLDTADGQSHWLRFLLKCLCEEELNLSRSECWLL